jgi:hypothetical protein
MFNDLQAARFLGLAKSTMSAWRARGIGPAYYKTPGAKGSVRYAEDDLKAFQTSCRVEPSVRAALEGDDYGS